MRRTLSLAAALILAAAVAFGPAPADGQVAAPKVNRKMLAVIALPDLVLEGLSVNPEPVSSDSTSFFLRFRVTVKNVGQAPVDKAFSIAFQHFHPTQSNWQGENDKNNCFAVTETLAPGGRTVREGRLRVLKSTLSDRDLRVRALADFACGMEFPPKNGQVAEADETNNASNEVTIPASTQYRPSLGKVSPSLAERGVDRVTLSGIGFGPRAGDHVVVIQQDLKSVAAAVQSWRDGVINFVVPASVNGGNAVVFIGDKASFRPVSNMLGLKVLETSSVSWQSVLEVWDVFDDAFSIRLHNWSGGPQEENVSEMKLLKIEPLDVQRVEFRTAVGDYRFLVNDLRSTTAALSRQGCEANQLRIDVPFESQGPEMVGYFKALGPAGAWRRTGAPDVEVDKAVVSVWLTFIPDGGRLNYSAHAAFEANIHSTNPAWKNILNAFVGGWEQGVKNQVTLLVKDRFNEGPTRADIIQSFTTVLRLATKTMVPQRTITRFKFKNAGIDVTFY